MVIDVFKVETTLIQFLQGVKNEINGVKNKIERVENKHYCMN